MSVAGDADRPALLLPDGWPHSRPLYDGVLEVQSDQRTRSGNICHSPSSLLNVNW
jgi:hypothetical protein